MAESVLKASASIPGHISRAGGQGFCVTALCCVIDISGKDLVTLKIKSVQIQHVDVGERLEGKV